MAIKYSHTKSPTKKCPKNYFKIKANYNGIDVIPYRRIIQSHSPRLSKRLNKNKINNYLFLKYFQTKI